MSKSNGIPVELAGRDFVIRRIPMAKVRKIGKTIAAIVDDISKTDIQAENATEAFIDKVLEVPHTFLSLFIKDLPKEIFEDEENGVDFPEFLAALNKAIEYNRIDVLKNLLARLAPMMAQVQASQSQKEN